MHRPARAARARRAAWHPTARRTRRRAGRPSNTEPSGSVLPHGTAGRKGVVHERFPVPRTRGSEIVSTISSITTLGRLDRREELRLHQRVRNRGDPDAKKLRAALLRVLTLLESLRCLEAEARQHLADVRALLAADAAKARRVVTSLIRERSPLRPCAPPRACGTGCRPACPRKNLSALRATPTGFEPARTENGQSSMRRWLAPFRTPFSVENRPSPHPASRYRDPDLRSGSPWHQGGTTTGFLGTARKNRSRPGDTLWPSRAPRDRLSTVYATFFSLSLVLGRRGKMSWKRCAGRQRATRRVPGRRDARTHLRGGAQEAETKVRVGQQLFRRGADN